MSNSPQRPSDTAPLAFLAGGGEMGERARSFDWSKTPVGPVAGWPQSLKTIVRTMLDSRYAMWLGWGPEFTFFYNDAYAHMTLGPKHPWALGRSAREVWAEIWPDIGPRAESVLRTGRATWDEGLLLFLERRGFPEETYHTFSYSPVPDDRGGVGGMLCVVTEDTERTIGERRLKTLRELAARTTDESKSVEEACQTAARTLAGNPKDVPFALLYLLDAGGRRAALGGAAGVGPGGPASPAAVDLAGDGGPWPFRAVAESGRGAVVPDLPARFGPLPGGPWPEPAAQAVVLPMAKPGQAQLAGFVVAGVSSRRPLDDGYRGFLDLLAGQVATAVANARAYEEERRRAEALAELDRAKTAFFSNVSHEFRTPLALMLGPIEDTLAEADGPLPPAHRERLEVVHRNGLRLQRLVNTLLDFSRIEAGRVRATFEPTDLAAFTADLASNFRSACEKAGLRLRVDCPPLGEPVFVDRPMWEKVVLNLVSNAFKFTLDGEIAVSVRRLPHAAELRVSDTGTGIPAEEMPRLFERFHRVENAQGRTHEGSGIGLALVQELVKLHGGTITAESELGRGTTFTVTLPLGSAHLPRERVGDSRAGAVTTTGASAFVEEALRWLPDAPDPTTAGPEAPIDGALSAPLTHSPQCERPRVLVADDNADMRQYLARILADQYRVEAVPDGEAALAAVRRQAPDLVLSDVMMPRLDGFGLLTELRADPRAAGIPVILLSARAGEESRVEGMQAGADDYLVKPFSARELLARVSAHLQMARLRREANESLRQRERQLQLVADSAPVMIAHCDAEGRYKFVNKPYAARFGLHPKDVIGQRIPDVVGEAAYATFRQYVAEALAGRPVEFEAEVPYQTGGTQFMRCAYTPERDARGQVVGLVAALINITDRKRAEEALRRQEAELREAQRVAHVGSWHWDAKTDVTTGSDELFRIYGLDPDKQAFPNFRDQDGWLYPHDSWLRIHEAAQQTMQSGVGYELDVRALRNGVPIWITTRGEIVRDAHGEPIGLRGTVQDITARKQAEEALQEADRRKDEFLATLAHELRNPLAPLRNGLQVMKLTRGNAEAAEQSRAMMERQLGQMVRLIDDLLDVSRISRGKITLRKERVELASVVQQAVETSRPLIDAQEHRLSVSVPPEPIYVDADVTRLAQVFANLLNNAAKYTEPGGRIALRIERQGGEAVVSVRDTGVGIPGHVLPNLFQMFMQVDRSLERSQGGLGIGLSIVKRLTEMHGGSVEARSDGHGKGSEFIVRLPVVLSPSAGRRSEGDGGAAGHGARRRILVVDDNRDAAASLAMVLRLMGNETQTAHDGLEALQVAEAFRPEIVLLDIGMPKLNGYDTARRMREQPWGRNTMLIALTGWGQEEDRRRSQEAGFDTHMTKPVDPAVLEKLLAGRQHSGTA